MEAAKLEWTGRRRCSARGTQARACSQGGALCIRAHEETGSPTPPVVEDGRLDGETHLVTGVASQVRVTPAFAGCSQTEARRMASKCRAFAARDARGRTATMGNQARACSQRGALGSVRTKRLARCDAAGDGGRRLDGETVTGVESQVRVTACLRGMLTDRVGGGWRRSAERSPRAMHEGGRPGWATWERRGSALRRSWRWKRRGLRASRGRCRRW
jgi:hypothetical protein